MLCSFSEASLVHSGKEFDFGFRKIPWRSKWQSIPWGKLHGQGSLVGYSPWGHKRIRLDLVTNLQQQFSLRDSCRERKDKTKTARPRPILLCFFMVGTRVHSHCLAECLRCFSTHSEVNPKQRNRKYNKSLYVTQ